MSSWAFGKHKSTLFDFFIDKTAHRLINTKISTSINNENYHYLKPLTREKHDKAQHSVVMKHDSWSNVHILAHPLNQCNVPRPPKQNKMSFNRIFYPQTVIIKDGAVWLDVI